MISIFVQPELLSLSHNALIFGWAFGGRGRGLGLCCASAFAKKLVASDPFANPDNPISKAAHTVIPFLEKTIGTSFRFI